MLTLPGVAPSGGNGPIRLGNAAHNAEAIGRAVCTAVAELPETTASMSGLFGALIAVGLSSGMRSKFVGAAAEAPTVSRDASVGTIHAGTVSDGSGRATDAVKGSLLVAAWVATSRYVTVSAVRGSTKYVCGAGPVLVTVIVCRSPVVRLTTVRGLEGTLRATTRA
jgi:hypothetical protein